MNDSWHSPQRFFLDGVPKQQDGTCFVLNIEYERLWAECERLRAAIMDHNSDCRARCGEGEKEGVACGYRPYFPRRCPTCPLYDIVTC